MQFNIGASVGTDRFAAVVDFVDIESVIIDRSVTIKNREMLVDTFLKNLIILDPNQTYHATHFQLVPLFNFVNFKPLSLRIFYQLDINVRVDIFFSGDVIYSKTLHDLLDTLHAADDRISCRDILQSLEISVSRCLQVLDRQLTTDGTYWYIRIPVRL